MFTGDGQHDQMDLASHVIVQAELDAEFYLDGTWDSADSLPGEFFAGNQNSVGAAYDLGDVVLEEAGLTGFFADLPSINASPGRLHALNEESIAHFIGPTGDQDPNLLRRCRFNDNSELCFKKLTIRTTSEGPNPTMWVLGLPQSPADNEGVVSCSAISYEDKLSLESLVPPEVGECLIALFMKLVSPHFPIFSSTNLPQPSQSPTYILAAIYLLAAPFFGQDDYLCIQFVYDRPLPRKLFELAWSSFSRNMHKASLSLVQTAILLLLSSPLDPVNADVPFKWTLVGILVSMSETIGLHLDPAKWNIPQHQIYLRRRISWAVFALDTWFAASLGRPPRITKENWMLDYLDQVDLESTGSDPGEHAFVLQFSKLTSIVSFVLQSLFTIRASETLTVDFRQVLERARPLLVKLSTWKDELPESVKFSGNEVHHTDILHLKCQLRLAYYATRIAIIRALLRSFDNPEIEYTINEADIGEFQAARRRCRNAAKTCMVSMIDFMSSLDSKDFEQFWPPWTSTLFSMISRMVILLVVTSKELGEASQYKFLLNKLRRVLHTQSRFFDPMRLANLRLDAHYWRGIDNILKMDSNLGCSFDELREVPFMADPE